MVYDHGFDFHIAEYYFTQNVDWDEYYRHEKATNKIYLHFFDQHIWALIEADIWETVQ